MEQGRQIEKVAGLYPRSTPFGEEQGDDYGVLFADLARQFGEDAGRHAEVDADVEDVANPHPAAGYDQHLVLFRQFADLFHERHDHLAAVVDCPMAADLDDIQIGNQPERGSPVLLPHEPLPDKGFTFELGVDFMPVGHMYSPPPVCHMSKKR